MKITSLIALLLVTSNAKDLDLSDYTDLAAAATTTPAASTTTTTTTAPAKAADAATTAKTDSTTASTTKVDGVDVKDMTPAEKAALLKEEKKEYDAKEAKKECSAEWKKIHGWTFYCMWDHPAD